jgi:hypothetical protein
LKKLAGTAATFAVSGIMHEFILLYALHEDNTYPAGLWFMFFFCQVRTATRTNASTVWGENSGLLNHEQLSMQRSKQ